MSSNITLTPQELEDLKDDIKFRTIVYQHIKKHEGVYGRVIKLEAVSWIQNILIVLVIGFIVKYGLATILPK